MCVICGFSESENFIQPGDEQASIGRKGHLVFQKNSDRELKAVLVSLRVFKHSSVLLYSIALVSFSSSVVVVGQLTIQPANSSHQMSTPDDSAPADSLISKEDGLKYWEGISADVNGMLGGIPAVQGFHGILRTDLQGSRTFLAKLGIGSKNGRHKVINALEGGAGSVSRTCTPI